MSTLSESAIRDMLPTPGGGAPPPPPTTPIPGTIPNTNPPAAGPGDALIFDPDENITYDPIQTMQRTSDVPPAPVMPSAVTPSKNVIDLEPETTPPPSGMGMAFWIVLVAVLIVVSIVIFFVVRSMSSGRAAPSTAAAASSSFDQMYGQRLA